MIAVDLNRDGRPDILVDAPGIAYFNDGSGKKFNPCYSATARERSTAWPRAMWMATDGRMLW
jgi:hypothetical protein